MKELTVFETPIYDDLIIEKLEEVGTLSCSMCSNEAAWRLSMRCCNRTAEFCQKHGDRVIHNMRRRLARAGLPVCLTCDHTFPVGATLEVVARVVKL